MRNGKGVVAAGHALTASAAAEILEDGGNAFDAAIAGAMMAFVAEAVFAAPGGGASATPGAMPGLSQVHEDLGRVPMKRLVEPAAKAARDGFPLSAFQAYLFTVIAPILTASAGAASIFAPGGRLLEAGAG